MAPGFKQDLWSWPETRWEALTNCQTVRKEAVGSDMTWSRCNGCIFVNVIGHTSLQRRYIPRMLLYINCCILLVKM